MCHYLLCVLYHVGNTKLALKISVGVIVVGGITCLVVVIVVLLVKLRKKKQDMPDEGPRQPLVSTGDPRISASQGTTYQGVDKNKWSNENNKHHGKTSIKPPP